MRFLKPTSRGWPWLRLTAAMLIIGWCFILGRGLAADPADLEYKVKAGHLFNFAKFVQWPESSFTNSTAPFVVGLVGNDPFGSLLEETLAGRTVNERGFVIRRFGPREDPGVCHILFVSRSERGRFAGLLDGLQGRAVLTVGEADQFGQVGGMINFIRVGGQVKMETNPEAASAAGLKISSKLLAASRTVRTGAAR